MKNQPSIKKAVDAIGQSLPEVFSTVDDKKAFLRNLMSVFINKPDLLKLNQGQVAACAFQLYLKDADMDAGEGFIITRKDKNGNQQAMTQTGYKYAIKKLYSTKQLKKYPETTPVKQGEIVSFNPHNRDVSVNVPNIKTAEKFKLWQKEPIEGYMTTFFMKDGSVIRKLFFKYEIEEHLLKYSDSYNAYQRDPQRNARGIWGTNKEDMFLKTALMKTYTKYLPKNNLINKAIQDINSLNNASYNQISQAEKPEYLDNPISNDRKIETKPEQIETIDVEPKKTFGTLPKAQKWTAWQAECLKPFKKKERTEWINKVMHKMMKDGEIEEQEFISTISVREYEMLSNKMHAFGSLQELNAFLEDKSDLVEKAKENFVADKKPELDSIEDRRKQIDKPVVALEEETTSEQQEDGLEEQEVEFKWDNEGNLII